MVRIAGQPPRVSVCLPCCPRAVPVWPALLSPHGARVAALLSPRGARMARHPFAPVIWAIALCCLGCLSSVLVALCPQDCCHKACGLTVGTSSHLRPGLSTWPARLDWASSPSGGGFGPGPWEQGVFCWRWTCASCGSARLLNGARLLPVHVITVISAFLPPFKEALFVWKNDRERESCTC